MGLPRILAIMGSGEIAPAMTKVQRELFARIDEAQPERGRVGGVLLDTPYRFQENANRLSERIVEHFRTSLGRELRVASFGRADGVSSGPAGEAAAALIESAAYVFSGPGSPTYALDAWRDSPIPEALVARLRRGGIVTMASAAALTLGRLTIPVYEIYKVGLEPTWLPGLDLLGRLTGLAAAVVPHYDNAEGADHDTRFCYMGERRLRALESLLPPEVFVLGVDGHTALVLDLDAATATVSGLGGVTIRASGRSERLPAGASVPIQELAHMAARLATGAAGPVEAGPADPLRAEGAFVAGGPEPEPEPAMDPGMAVLVATLMELRSRARAARDWRAADDIRDRLAEAGVEVRDDADGASSWEWYRISDSNR